MMKTKAFIATALLSLTAATFAATESNNGYYTSQHPGAHATTKKGAAYFPPTDIRITNNAAEVIYATVPGTSIYDAIAPTANDHIRNGTYYGDTHLVLLNAYQTPIFDQYVCRLALVDVYGQYPNYHVNIDTEYCH